MRKREEIERRKGIESKRPVVISAINCEGFDGSEEQRRKNSGFSFAEREREGERVLLARVFWFMFVWNLIERVRSFCWRDTISRKKEVKFGQKN